MVVGPEQKTLFEQQLLRERTAATGGVPADKVFGLAQRMDEDREAELDLQAQHTAKTMTASLQAGEIPSNRDIINVLERGERCTESRNDPTLSSEARATAGDVQSIITGLKQTVLEKNPDEALQKAAYHSKEAAAEAQDALPASPLAKTQADVQQAAKVVNDLAMLLVRSNEFRGLINDVGNFLRQIVMNKWEETKPEGQSMEQQGQDLMSNIHQAFSNNQPSEAVSQLGDQFKEKTRTIYESLDDENIKNEVIEKLQTWMTRINRRDDFRNGIRDLITTFREFQLHAQEVSDYVNEDPDALKFRVHSATARQEARKLLERFSQNHSLNNIINAMKSLSTDVRNDEHLDAFLNHLREFVFKCLENPEFVKSDEFRQECRSLLDESRGAVEKYQEHFNYFFDETSGFMKDFTGDKLLTQINTSTQSLARRLFMDENGRPTINTGSLMELRKILGPLLQEELKYIYIPRLSHDDEGMAWMMENILIQGDDILPDKIVVENYNKAVVTLGDEETEPNVAVIRANLTGIRAHVKDVHMAYKRKTFPKLEDVITFDAHIAGKGVSVEIILAVSKHPNQLFRVANIITDVDEFTLQNIHGVEHSDLLYSLMKPIIQSQARKSMERGLVEAINERLVELDQLLVDYKQYISFS